MTEHQQPRVLVCSVGAWNSKVGDNTFPMLLQGYENVASLFIREETPDSPVASAYFRVSEAKVMHSLLHRKAETGETVVPGGQDGSALNEQKQLYGKKQRFYYCKLFAREVIWLLGRWKTPALTRFICEQKPDIVLYEMSRYIHLNRIIRYALKLTGAKGVGCFWDDTFTYRQERGCGFRLLRFFQRKSLKKLAAETQAFFAITPKTKREADEFFHINCSVLTKPVPVEGVFEEAPLHQPLQMLYTGNLGIGRCDTLADLAEAIQQLPEAANNFFMDIYTNTQLTAEEQQRLEAPFVCIHGAVTQSEVLALQKQADILLFAESLDENNKTARLSFSTKITDYYAAGKCILAIGNADLAPMELFAETDSAITVTKKEQLPEALCRLLEPENIRQYARKAHETGIKNHASADIRALFDQTLLRCAKETDVLRGK